MTAERPTHDLLGRLAAEWRRAPLGMTLFAITALASLAFAGILLIAVRGGPRAVAPLDPIAAAQPQMPGVITLYVFDEKGERTGQGSGFVLDPLGLAATNVHVLDGAYHADAELGDGRRYEVLRVHGWDAEQDLAVFQLGRVFRDRTERPNDLHALDLALGADVEVGDRIATITSPKGLENTVSEGVVSAMRDEDEHHYLQISAPISPGSSGGPVFNRKGKVIGVVTSQFEEGQNLNFAVPIDSLAKLLRVRGDLTLPEFQQRLEAERDSTGEPDDYDHLVDKGSDLFDEEEYHAALDQFVAAQRLDPDAADAYYNAGLCYDRLGKNRLAADQFRRYLARAPLGEEDRRWVVRWMTRHDYPLK